MSPHLLSRTYPIPFNFHQYRLYQYFEYAHHLPFFAFNYSFHLLLRTSHLHALEQGCRNQRTVRNKHLYVWYSCFLRIFTSFKCLKKHITSKRPIMIFLSGVNMHSKKLAAVALQVVPSQDDTNQNNAGSFKSAKAQLSSNQIMAVKKVLVTSENMLEHHQVRPWVFSQVCHCPKSQSR